MDEKHPKHSVVVVGAGISGLTAARELVKQYPDLLVVEARQQKGGRVCEVRQLRSMPACAHASFSWLQKSGSRHRGQIGLQLSNGVIRLAVPSCSCKVCFRGLSIWGQSLFMVPRAHSR